MGHFLSSLVGMLCARVDKRDTQVFEMGWKAGRASGIGEMSVLPIRPVGCEGKEGEVERSEGFMRVDESAGSLELEEKDMGVEYVMEKGTGFVRVSLESARVVVRFTKSGLGFVRASSKSTRVVERFTSLAVVFESEGQELGRD